MRTKTMGKIPLARVGQLLQVTKTLEECGTSPVRLLRRLNMPMWHYCEPDGFVPLSQIYELISVGARLVGDETFGVQVMERAPFQTMGKICGLAASAPTTYQALKTFIRYFPTYGTSKSWYLAEGRDEVWFCRGGSRTFDVGEEQMTIYALTGMVQLIRLGAGASWRPSKVKVQAADTLGLDATDMFSEAQILPDPAVSAIAIPRSLLSLLICRVGEPQDSPDEVLEERFDASAPADDFAGSLRQVIGTLLGEGCPQIHDAAEILGLRVRTLQRRLERDGVTYKQLVDGARYEAATPLLKDGDTPISAIAFDLGYSDVAHFSRAFHRWAGVSPRTYRRLNLAQ